MAKLRFGLKVALRPPEACTLDHATPGAFDEAGPHWVEMNVFHFLVVFLNASQRAVERSRLPEREP
jgi:hypothetical protein